MKSIDIRMCEDCPEAPFRPMMPLYHELGPHFCVYEDYCARAWKNGYRYGKEENEEGQNG